MTNEFEGINSPVTLDKCNDEAPPTLCLDNKLNRSDESSKKTNINDLSRSLVTSLQNANKRLSTLMQPKLSNHDSTLRPSKANISLPTNSIIKRKIIRNDNQENVTSFQNCYKNCTEDFSDIEIDFEKVTNTLQQAKAFSVELTKVLNDYQMANNKLESKSLKDSIGMNIYSNPKLFTNLEQSTYNIEINQSINSDAYYEELFSHVGHDRSPYDPVKKYGSHNLNVTATNKNKHEKFEMDEKTDCSNKIVLINSEIDHAVDEDLISYESTYKQQNKENVSHQLSKENIPIDHSSQSDRHIDGDLDEKYKFCKHRCRSNKTQKNVNRLRVPRSLILYKRLKLKEALINLASATCTGTRQNLEPQSFQVSNRALITNSTTQDEQFPREKRETTSTSTDMLGSYEHSRFTQPIQADQTLENSSWSILKKNCILNTPYLKNKGFSIMPPLLLEVKDTLRAISRQSGEAGRSDANNEVKVTGHGNKALLKLQTEVNRLWESSVPQSSDESASKTRSPMLKSKLDLRAKSFNVASSQTCNVTSSVEKAVDCMDNTFSVVGKSSCDTFKVKFLGLRRVSDHTVLVKWKAPPNVSRVQGYELLVDGRAVQKILSPTRCMAVVTCLPHIERVLITIRTLLPPGLDRPHYPSATIVYQPRAK
ncbi:uncharacterized protein LOC135076325 [Ostrinia nubilalis]|uniref:uncharacterized protein LOC135076325 n=1 Tax=Ostrinia nubilalis TaxID=29057 RepID=UPI00308254CD